MKKKTILLTLVLTCTLLFSVGCGRRMNSATDGTDKNNQNTQDTTVEENTTNDNPVDGAMNGIEDTVDGVVDGVEDVIDGTENSVNDMTTQPNDTNTTTKMR